jgi:hypothetical protein
MIRSMEPAADLDVQAYCRSLALQQVQMLTRLAEIGMQLAEAEGTRALAAQARAAEPGFDETSVAAIRAEAQEAGLGFSRFARSVQRSLSLRARAADQLCARDKAQAADRAEARETRRYHHRLDVENTLSDVIQEMAREPRQAVDLQHDLEDRLEDLYDDEEVRVEDRPLGSVMAGLACGLGVTEEWERHWAPSWPGTPKPAKPVGDPAKIEAERARRRDAAIFLVEEVFARFDPDRLPGLRAGLAVRLQEADVTEWFDTQTSRTAADRLCRSLGVDPYHFVEDLDEFDTG